MNRKDRIKVLLVSGTIITLVLNHMLRLKMYKNYEIRLKDRKYKEEVDCLLERSENYENI